MAIALDKILINSETRVRLIFSGALASGAFVASLYSTTDVTLDAAGPAVVAALAVAGFNNQVELVLGSPLAAGNAVSANCSAVPGADLSTFSGSLSAVFGASVTFTPNVEPEQDASDALVFGRDVVHDGADYVEDATGDLVSVEGVPNVEGALYRRVRAYGLPWDPSFGPKLDDYVDGPNEAAAPATGLIKQQMLADDRTQSCSVTLEEDDTAAGGAFFRVEPILKTDRKIPPFDVAVADVLSTDSPDA